MDDGTRFLGAGLASLASVAMITKASAPQWLTTVVPPDRDE